VFFIVGNALKLHWHNQHVSIFEKITMVQKNSA